MPMIDDERGITCSASRSRNLDDDAAVQLALPFDPRGGALDAALDDVRERFGSASVTCVGPARPLVDADAGGRVRGGRRYMRSSRSAFLPGTRLRSGDPGRAASPAG